MVIQIEVSWRLEMKQDNDIHTEHCCKYCGCKFDGDRPLEDPWNDELIIECSVVDGNKLQSIPHVAGKRCRSIK